MSNLIYTLAKTHVLKRQTGKYLLVGIFNTIAHYGVYSALKFDYRLAVLFANIFGILFSFFMFSQFVFSGRKRNAFIKFVALYILLYLVNISLISLLNTTIHNYYISGLFAIIFCAVLLFIFCAVLSFILNKVFIFKNI